jgi:pSer/pThr/pTyr-binding forkhead associated (FHA) protein
MAGNRQTDDERTLDPEHTMDPGDVELRTPADDGDDVTDSDHAMLRVRVSLKGRPIRSYTFDKDVITAGRDPDSEIYLDNPGISRHHLRMEKTPNGYYAEDLGSANGSYLNDEPIQKELLKSDDVLRIGKFSLWISYEEDRRMGDSADKIVSPTTRQGTTVLSTSELETMMAKVRAADDKPTVLQRSAVRPRSGVSKAAFVTWIIVTLLLGAALGAGAFWVLIR